MYLSKGLRLQSGISLVEAMLAVMIAIALLFVLGETSSQASSDMKAKNVAETTQSVKHVALQYLTDNRTAIQKAVTSGTDANQYCVINANATTGTGGVTRVNTTKKTCGLDVNWLKFKKFAPVGLSSVNEYNQRIFIIYRLVPDAATEDFEMLIVGGENAGNHAITPPREGTLAAEIMGGNGGFIPAQNLGSCEYNVTTKHACGTGGGWRLNLNDFIG